MQARAVWRPERDQLELYLLDDSPIEAGRRFYSIGADGELALQDVPAGTAARPALRLASPAYEQLRAALIRESSHADPGAHLKDAISVRDRLLALVEHQLLAG